MLLRIVFDHALSIHQTAAGTRWALRGAERAAPHLRRKRKTSVAIRVAVVALGRAAGLAGVLGAGSDAIRADLVARLLALDDYGVVIVAGILVHRRILDDWILDGTAGTQRHHAKTANGQY